MNKLILYIVAFLIGILLFKLLYNCECFNVGIQIEQTLMQIEQKFDMLKQK